MIKALTKGICLLSGALDEVLEDLQTLIDQDAPIGCDYIIDLREMLLSPSLIKKMDTLLKRLQTDKKTLVAIADPQVSDLATDELPKVPTLQEAEDYLAFEQMQRDLGF